MASEFYILFLKDGSTGNSDNLKETTYLSVLADIVENHIMTAKQVLEINEEDGKSRDVTEDIARDYWKTYENLYDGTWDGKFRVIPDFILEHLDIDEDNYQERHVHSDYEEHNTLNRTQQGV